MGVSTSKRFARNPPKIGDKLAYRMQFKRDDRTFVVSEESVFGEHYVLITRMTPIRGMEHSPAEVHERYDGEFWNRWCLARASRDEKRL